MTLTFLGIDTGGTFTDFVAISEAGLEVHKVLSSPSAPEQAVLQGIEDMGLNPSLAAGNLYVVHGTTVATNAVLEGKGVKTVYITNKGLKDVLTIGRQTRKDLYDLNPPIPQALFDPELMLEVSLRSDANGQLVSDFKAGELERLVEKVSTLKPQAIAINLLFSFLAPEHEKQIEARFSENYFVSRSSKILPEIQEYERGLTTWINAWIGPLIKNYVSKLEAKLSPSNLAIMQSSGLTIRSNLAADRAVNLLLSGPAGGLAAAQHLGKLCEIDNLMTFDMGGTSTDVSLIEGQFKITNQGEIGGMPIGVPMADIHTIGAGGGSIAYVDNGGLLKVGPESAGAVPGPACYKQGGTKPTVTDANLVLGRFGGTSLAGGLEPSIEQAKAAIEPIARVLKSSIEETAFGIIQLANEHMSQALRVISVERGYDPREFVLMCFGGAGGLPLCDLAESLEIKSAILPIHAGVLSALGLISSKPGRELVRTKQISIDLVDDEELEVLFEALRAEALLELKRENVHKTKARFSLDLRYAGQTATINIAFDTKASDSKEKFQLAHEGQYGHRMDREVEMLNYRLHIEAVEDELKLPPYQSESNQKGSKIRIYGLDEEVLVLPRSGLGSFDNLKGPLLITEAHATTYIKKGWQVKVDEIGNLRLTNLT